MKPHVPSTCEFAKSVKACCSNRRDLHSSNVEALGPAMRHTINYFFLFSVAALLSIVAVKLLLEVKKRSKFSSPTENNTEKLNNTNKPRQE